MERTYLWSYGDGPFGASTSRRTRAQILAHPRFAKVHPVLMDRLFALADAVIAAGGDYGFGGGWRSSIDQYNLFRSRYERTADGFGIYWNGQPNWPNEAGWYVRVRGAAAAPPGSSYHESTTREGFALAVDMVGDHTRANALAARFGVRHFANVNNEPWHYQPVEIPNARRNYRGEFENVSLPQEDMSMWTIVKPSRVYDSRNDSRGRFKAREVRKVPVALGGEAFIAGAVTGPGGFWSYTPDGDFDGNLTSFSNPAADGNWHNFGAIPVLCPGGHIFVYSHFGGDIYIDTYGYKA